MAGVPPDVEPSEDPGFVAGAAGPAGGVGAVPSAPTGGAGGTQPSAGGAGCVAGVPSAFVGGVGGVGGVAGVPSALVGGAGSVAGVPPAFVGGTGSVTGVPPAFVGGVGGVAGVPSAFVGGAGGVDPSGSAGGAGQVAVVPLPDPAAPLVSPPFPSANAGEENSATRPREAPAMPTAMPARCFRGAGVGAPGSRAPHPFSKTVMVSSMVVLPCPPRHGCVAVVDPGSAADLKSSLSSAPGADMRPEAPMRGSYSRGMLPPARVLVVEDDAAIRAAVVATLTAERFVVRGLASGVELEEEVKGFLPDLVVLDWMLPGPSGIQLAERIRRWSDASVIMLTARDAVEDRLRGFGQGVDDYIVKPFALAELVARVGAVLRRRGRLTSVVEIGDLLVDPDAGLARRGGEQLELTSIEFQLLAYLAAHRGRTLSKTQLLTQVWGYDQADPNLVEVHISALRKKMEAHGPRLLHTVRGLGYRVEA